MSFIMESMNDEIHQLILDIEQLEKLKLEKEKERFKLKLQNQKLKYRLRILKEVM